MCGNRASLFFLLLASTAWAGSPSVSDLLSQLRSLDPAAKKQAAKHLVTASTEALPDLLQTLQDRDSEIVLRVLDILEQRAQDADSIFLKVLPLVLLQDSRIQIKAIETLFSLERFLKSDNCRTLSQSFTNSLIQLLRNPDSELRWHASRFLSVRPDRTDTVQQLKRELLQSTETHANPFFQVRLADELVDFGEGAFALSFLQVLAKNETEYLQVYVALALARIPNEDYCNGLAAFLRDGNDDQKTFALREITWLGPKGLGTAPALLKALRELPETWRNRILSALRSLGPGVALSLLPDFERQELSIQKSVLKLLTDFGLRLQSLPSDFYIKLTPWLSSPDEELRAYSAALLFQHDPESEKRALSVLIDLFVVPNGEFYNLTKETLVNSPEKSIDALVKLLEEPTKRSARIAASALSNMGPKAKKAGPALYKAYHTTINDGVWHIAEDYFDALASLELEVFPLLLEASRDPGFRTKLSPLFKRLHWRGVPFLLQAMTQKENAALVQELAKIILEIGEENKDPLSPEEARLVLLPLVVNENCPLWRNSFALENFIYRTGKLSQSLITDLMTLLRNESLMQSNKWMLNRLLVLLALLGKDAECAIEEVKKYTDNPDENIRSQACWTLRAIAP